MVMAVEEVMKKWKWQATQPDSLFQALTLVHLLCFCFPSAGKHDLRVARLQLHSAEAL